MSVPSRSSASIYSNDFYFLYGNQSFLQYLSDNRQCYNQGAFPQLQSETLSNRFSSDKPERCSLKPFDCAFGDLYSFEDRDQMYQQPKILKYFDRKPLKCGFAIPSIFDTVRYKYGRNQTCQTVVFTVVTNCYDPLPEVEGPILPSFCFIALLDTQTLKAHRIFYAKEKRSTSDDVQWDLIDLGANASPFLASAKSIETLKLVGPRMFPVAKWIIWLDGKAYIQNIGDILLQTQSPMIIPSHPDTTRTSASEVEPTIVRLKSREKSSSQQLNISIAEI
ncbi:unnamed protein product, partial [Rotaria socialis]